MQKETIEATKYKLVKAGVNLDETKTIHDAGIKSGATLVANFNSITIKVKLDNKSFDVEVDPDNKVKTIKDAVKEIKQVVATRYTLKMGTVTLDDTKTIYASGIKAGTIVTADLNAIKIKVDIDGKVVEVNVDPDNKVKVIKDKIKAAENIEGTRYKLVKGGVTLDDTKTIYESGITKDATVVANFNSISIQVKLGTKTFAVDVDPDNKVSTIRDAIKTKESITTDGF
jgi:hypothetical protein